MNGSKIKNIVIIILLLVNLAFLSMVITQKIDSNSRQQRVKEEIVEILANNGIEIDDAIIPYDKEFTEYIAGRDMERELSAVEAVIGPYVPENQGGNIYYYAGENGWARFRGNGEFEIALNPGSGKEYSGDSSLSLLKEMGIYALEKKLTESGNNIIGDYICTLNDKLIFDCVISFVYEDGNLISVSGKRPMSSMEYRTDRSSISVSTALMKFTQHMKAGGYICSSIDKIDSGYMMIVSLSGECRFIPIWHIGTDAGDYYLDGITGEMIKV